eukprot:PhM_4_TR8376/c0_g1_i1/m.65993/K12400/AP4E1; AP-4 complex subunit epsilon-1
MSKLQKAKNSTAHSRQFFELIRSIGESKSKQEEDKIIAREVAVLKAKLAEESNDSKTTRELVIRVVYCEMLGHFAEFGYIHAIKLISATELNHKRVGYMATWLCIPPTHELVYLVVANLQKDLKSPNFLEVSAALNAINKLINPELIPCLLNDVKGLMKHAQAPVRKKAVVAIHSFYKKDEASIGDNRQYRIALCDKDPQVMNGALMLIHDVACIDPASQRDLVPSLISILKQITEHRLTRDYDYHRIPAPWIQIKVLRILALVGAGDEDASQKMYDVLAEVFKRADTGLNIGNAVIYEAIRTTTSIVPHPELLESAAEHVGKFLASTSANLKYLGITALSNIVTIDPRHAAPHQHIVIDCLEDVDDTIRRKTLSLLYAMTNPRNVEVIVNRLTKYLEVARDAYLRAEMVHNLCDIIDKFSSSNTWYIDSMTRVLELGAAHFQQETLQGMLKLVAEGDGEDETEDALFRTYCVEKFYSILGSSTEQADAMYQVGAWIVGEYGFLCNKISPQMMVDRLCDILERPHLADVTRGWIVTACMKLIAQQRAIPDNIEEVVMALKDSTSLSLQQRCHEFSVLFNHLDTLAEILPLDGCCEDITVDPDLHVLDAFVNDSVARNGGKRYDKDTQGGLIQEKKVEVLKTEAYKLAQSNKVDEKDLTLEKLQESAPDKLIVSDSHKRWGKANLEAPEPEPEPEPVKHVDPFEETPAAGSMAESAAASGAVAAPGKTRRTQREKFASDLFGGMGDGEVEVRTRTRRTERGKSTATAAPATTTPKPSSSPTASAAPAAAAPVPAPKPQPTSSNMDELFGGPIATSAPVLSKGTVFDVVASHRQFQYGGPMNVSSSTLNLDAETITLQVFFTLMARSEDYDISFQPNPKCMWKRLQCSVDGSSVSADHVYIPGSCGGQGIIQLQLGLVDVPWTGAKAPVSIVLCQMLVDGRSQPISCAAGDLLRPSDIPIEVFGTKWPTTAGEATAPGVSVGRGVWPDVASKGVLKRANIKVVSVIGQELVAAAELMTPQKTLLLTHVRYDAESGTAHFTVRCENKGLSEAVAKCISTA